MKRTFSFFFQIFAFLCFTIFCKSFCSYKKDPINFMRAKPFLRQGIFFNSIFFSRNDSSYHKRVKCIFCRPFLDLWTFTWIFLWIFRYFWEKCKNSIFPKYFFAMRSSGLPKNETHKIYSTHCQLFLQTKNLSGFQ